MMNYLTKRAGFGLLAIALAATALPAQAGKCSEVDIPVTFTIGSTTPAGIVSDGLGDYVNGQNGVIALIHTCNGSNGATLNPGTAGRSVTFNFQTVVDTNHNTPSWTSGSVAFFTVSNLLYQYNPATTYSFTTSLWSTMGNSGYFFRMENPSAQAPFQPPAANVNSPCVTSLVYVTHYPAGALSAKETWIAWPGTSTENCSSAVSGTPVQVGTLMVQAHPSAVSAGQFTVPFYITITRQ
jgi:hypothetical protein